MTPCIGEPVSWPRLEQFALDAADPAIAAHVAACPACRQCLDDIRGDVVALPALVAPAGPARAVRATWRRWWLGPALAAAAAAVVLVVVLRPPRPEIAGDRVAIKGVGEVVLDLVRERGGAIAFGVRDYAPGDRWKAVVTCPPGAAGAASALLAIDVSVADGLTVDHPLPAARIACGNRVVVPGAFTVTGDRPNRVCARITAAADASPGTACVMVMPAPR